MRKKYLNKFLIRSNIIMSNNIFVDDSYDSDHSSDNEVKTIEKIDKNEIKHFKNITKNGIIDGPMKENKIKAKTKPKLTSKSPTKKTPLESFGLLTNQSRNSDKFSDSENDSNQNDDDDDTASLSLNDNFETMSNNSQKKSDDNVIDFDKPFNNIHENIQLMNTDEDEEDDDDNINSIPKSPFGMMNDNNNEDDDNQTLSTNHGEDDDNESEDEYSVREKTYEEIQSEKQDLLFKLDRLEKSGFKPSRRYTMASSIEDLQYEYTKLKRQRDVEKSIKFSRKILMAIVSGIEFLNGKFDPFDIRLKGWSENVMESITDYDEVFEELHDKYNDSVKVSPELKLLMMVCGSAFMFHLTQSLFKTNSPSLNDILKQNPDIMKNISQAAAQSMGPAMGDDFIGNMMKEGINQNINRQFNNERSGPPPNPFSNSASPVMQPMGPLSPPKNNNDTIDNIVKELSGGKSKSKKKKNNSKGITLDL